MTQIENILQEIPGLDWKYALILLILAFLSFTFSDRNWSFLVEQISKFADLSYRRGLSRAIEIFESRFPNEQVYGLNLYINKDLLKVLAGSAALYPILSTVYSYSTNEDPVTFARYQIFPQATSQIQTVLGLTGFLATFVLILFDIPKGINRSIKRPICIIVVFFAAVAITFPWRVPYDVRESLIGSMAVALMFVGAIGAIRDIVLRRETLGDIVIILVGFNAMILFATNWLGVVVSFGFSALFITLAYGLRVERFTLLFLIKALLVVLFCVLFLFIYEGQMVMDAPKVVLFYFGVLFPVINAVFDYVSLSITKNLMAWAIRSPAREAFGLVVFDLILAIVTLVFLCAALFIALDFSVYIFDADRSLGFVSAVELAQAIENDPELYGWFYIMLFSTFIPSILHLGLFVYIISSKGTVAIIRSSWTKRLSKNIRLVWHAVVAVCLTTYFLLPPYLLVILPFQVIFWLGRRFPYGEFARSFSII